MRNIRTQLIEIVVMFFVPVASLAMLRSIELEDAKLFPNYICYIMLVFAVIHAFQVFKSWRKDKAEKGEPAPFPMRRVAVALGLMIIYFLSMEAVGFYLDGFLFFLVTTLVLESGRLTAALVGRKAFCAVCFMAVLYLLFNTMLGVMTPSGIWM